MLKDDDKWSIIEGIIAVQFIFVALKVIGLVSWSWIWVWTPLWLSVIILGIVLLIGFSFLGKLVRFIKNKGRKL
jgi:hypothetical protein